MNVEENQNKENSSLVEREQIPKTPFYINKHNEEWFITMGKHIITHKYPTKEEAMDCLTDEKWFVIMTIAHIIVEQYNEHKKAIEDQG